MANIGNPSALPKIIEDGNLSEDELSILNPMAAKKMSLDEVKAVYVLRKQAKSEREIAAIVGRDKRYVVRILDKIMVSPLKTFIDNAFQNAASSMAVEKVRDNLQLAAKDRLAYALAAITPQKLADASIGDLSKIVKVNYDIYRLETGQSTQNIGVAGLIKTESADNEIAKKLLEKMNVLEKFFAEKGVDVGAL